MLPEETDEELPSFLEAVRARLIHLPSMDRALRLVTGVALAQLAACAILLAGASTSEREIAVRLSRNLLFDDIAPCRRLELLVLCRRRCRYRCCSRGGHQREE